jgi:hypothetical protein
VKLVHSMRNQLIKPDNTSPIYSNANHVFSTFLTQHIQLVTDTN